VAIMFDKLLHKKIHRSYKDVFDLDSPQVVAVLSDMCKAHGVFDGGLTQTLV